MKKAIVIGCPGSGKSCFSRALHRATGLPLIHLDMLYWNDDQTTVPGDVFAARLQNVLGQEQWIIDGNYASTLELRLRACDTVFFLDIPTEICLEGIAARRGKARADLPWVETEYDDAFVDFIRHFQQDVKPGILELLKNCPGKELLVFHSRREADAYLSAL